ncbi:hypothetical protein [Roseobacter cerasinus]|uniref:hypothetical protein n=1 Tax=Roseobacter cerasinus TaxID=2602289 RepID=UPI0015766F30|nr:hypothetical protein [Roseobacter cerasinus]
MPPYLDLRELKVMFLHLDEAQDRMGSQSKPEMVAVVNKLKGVMQNPHWPVSIILTTSKSTERNRNGFYT